MDGLLEIELLKTYLYSLNMCLRNFYTKHELSIIQNINPYAQIQLIITHHGALKIILTISIKTLIRGELYHFTSPKTGIIPSKPINQ